MVPHGKKFKWCLFNFFVFISLTHKFGLSIKSVLALVWHGRLKKLEKVIKI